MNKTSKEIAIIGGGPAGLMAAQHLLKLGHKVRLYEAKPSLARKLQLAGRGGLNLTHSEPHDKFVTRYYENAEFFTPLINKFSPQDLRDYCHALGQETFVGTSGRVFPKKFKATEFLRAWIIHLLDSGLEIHTRHKWVGFDQHNNPQIENEKGDISSVTAGAVLLALGGASWAKMGSDGTWVDYLEEKGVSISPLVPANCGFETSWPSSLSTKSFGQPLKNISLSLKGAQVKGEIMISSYGLEGGAIYAMSKAIRAEIDQKGETLISIDLKPKHAISKIEKILGDKKSGLNVSRILKQDLKLSPAALELIKAFSDKEEFNSPSLLARKIKELKIPLTKPRPIDRAISTAGGIKFSSCDDKLMLNELPGIFVAGEMLDWEAPTGGYLLQGCFSMAVHVAKGIDGYLTNLNK